MAKIVDVEIVYDGEFQLNKLLSMFEVVNNNPSLSCATLRVDERRISFIESLYGIKKVSKSVDTPS